MFKDGLKLNCMLVYLCVFVSELRCQNNEIWLHVTRKNLNAIKQYKRRHKLPISQ